MLQPDDVTERIQSELCQLSEQQGLAVLGDFSHADLRTVRNVPGYIIGIIKKLPRGRLQAGFYY
jgi:hypothetical protein